MAEIYKRSLSLIVIAALVAADASPALSANGEHSTTAVFHEVFAWKSLAPADAELRRAASSAPHSPRFYERTVNAALLLGIPLVNRITAATTEQDAVKAYSGLVLLEAQLKEAYHADPMPFLGVPGSFPAVKQFDDWKIAARTNIALKFGRETARRLESPGTALVEPAEESAAARARAPVLNLKMPDPLKFTPALDGYEPAILRYGAGVEELDFSDYADPLVQVHLQSHVDLARWAHEMGFISQTVYRFLLGAIRDHDFPYKFSKPQDLEQRAPQLKLVWRTIAAALHPDRPSLADELGEKTYQFMLRAFDRPELIRIFQEEAGVPQAAAEGMAAGYAQLVGIIIGHGSMGVVESMRQLESAGMGRDQALSFGLLIGLHHPNFPITLVHEFSNRLTAKAKSLAIPPALWGPLLIRGGWRLENAEMSQAEKDALAFSDAEDLRFVLSGKAAKMSGISHAEALMISILIYTFDRLTAVWRNYPDASDFRPGENGIPPGFASWNKGGAPRRGEIPKKLGLVLTNMRPVTEIRTREHVLEFTFPAALETLIKACRQELQVSADVILNVERQRPEDVTAMKARQFQALASASYLSATFALNELQSINDRILQYLADDPIPGFSGLVVDLDGDIKAVHRRAQEIGRDHRDYDLVSYLLAALVAVRVGKANQATLSALKRVWQETNPQKQAEPGRVQR